MMSAIISKTSRSDTRNIDPEHAANRDIALRGLPRGNFGCHLPPRVRQAIGGSTAPEPGISLVASLVIMALVLDWLAQVLEWSARSLIEFQNNGVTLYTMSRTGSSFASWLSYLALAIFVGAGVLNATQLRRPRLPVLVPFFLCTMLAYGTFWVIVGFDPSEYRYAFAMRGPLLFVMCLGVYSGLDLTLWRRLRPIVLALAFFSVALSAYYTIQLSVLGKFEGPTPMNQHMQSAFWFALAALVIGGSTGWKGDVLALIPIALCVPIAILMASRSWTLLAIFGFGLGLKIVFQEILRLSATKSLALGLFASVILLAGIWLLSIAFPERFDTFKGRLGEDTRSSQYSQFFQQVPVAGLITGLGPKATYTYNALTDYNYIDNQFLFILFKFGLPVLLGYFAVVLWPGLYMLVNAVDHRERSLGFFFGTWTLATLGVSTFHSITNNPQNLMAILLAGRCFLFMTLSGKSASNRQGPVRLLRRRLASGTTKVGFRNLA